MATPSFISEQGYDTLSKTARKLGVSYACLYRLRKMGQLEGCYMMVGKTLFYSADKIKQKFAQNEQSTDNA